MNYELFISNGFSELRGIYPPPNQLISQNKAVLQRKKDRGNGTEQGYIDSLSVNIGFLIKSNEEIIKLIERYVNKRSFASYDILSSDINLMQAKLRTDEYNLRTYVYSLYNKFNTNDQKIDNMEFDYMYYSAYNDILLRFTGACCEILSSNKNLVDEFYNAGGLKVTDCIKKNCSFSANVLLNNITFK